MLTKDHIAWRFDLLQELIEGPLLNPKRLEEAIRGSRFIRRLLSFFHPFGSGTKFCDLPRTKVRYTFFFQLLHRSIDLINILRPTKDG